MIDSTQSSRATDPGRKQLTIKVFGVGGCGGNIAEHIFHSGFSGVSLITLNTDAQALRQSPLPHKFSLGLRLTGGLGAGGDPARGRAAAEEDFGRLREICEDADMVFICAGLGGGTGTGAAPVLARAAKECGALVLAFVTLPFECEGPKRMRQAREGFEELKAAADGVICLPNQKVFRLIDENTSVIETFKITNDLLAQGVRGIWQLVTRTGLINLDFADLCSVVRDRHAESSFATAMAEGPQRAREVVEKLLANPLLADGETLGEADAVLISLIGGPSLTMAEVNRVMEQVNRRCENAHLMMGAAIEEHLADQLTVTLVASRRRSHLADLPSAPAEAPAPAERETRPRSGEDRAWLGAAIASLPVERSPATTGPETTPELLSIPAVSRSWRTRKKGRTAHPQLPLQTIAKGLFEHSEPTMHNGVDLDVPTFVRRGMAMN